MNEKVTPEIAVRKALTADYDFFYGLKSEGTNLTWTGYNDKPDHDQLRHWFCQQLTPGGNREIYIIEANTTPVGYLYVDLLNCSLFELAIGVSEKYTGKHIGTQALLAIVALYRKSNPKAEFVAWIREDNIASMKAFTQANFIPTPECLKRWIAPLDKEINMIKYVLAAV